MTVLGFFEIFRIRTALEGFICVVLHTTMGPIYPPLPASAFILKAFGQRATPLPSLPWFGQLPPASHSPPPRLGFAAGGPGLPLPPPGTQIPPEPRRPGAQPGGLRHRLLGHLEGQLLLCGPGRGCAAVATPTPQPPCQGWVLGLGTPYPKKTKPNLAPASTALPRAVANPLVGTMWTPCWYPQCGRAHISTGRFNTQQVFLRSGTLHILFPNHFKDFCKHPIYLVTFLLLRFS